MPARVGGPSLLPSSPPFALETAEAASAQWRAVADQIRPKVSKLAAIRAEADVLAYMSFPKKHRAKLYSINLIERIAGWEPFPRVCL